MQKITTRDEVRTLLRPAKGRHYVYVLCRPCGAPFYVGKGIGDRVFHHESAAINTTLRSHKLNTIRALHDANSPIGYRVEILSSQEEALARERSLILEYGRHDLGTGPLTNMTDGGEGPANFSEETRQRHRETLAGVLEDGSARSAVNAFFLRIGVEVRSIPIKPLGERRLEPLAAHAQSRRPTPRQAAALVALAIGNRVILSPGCLLRRQFALEDGLAVLENGAGKDLIKSGMLRLSDAVFGNEQLQVTQTGFDAAHGFVGKETMLSFGVLMPER